MIAQNGTIMSKFPLKQSPDKRELFSDSEETEL
jgi:hypothetical protein